MKPTKQLSARAQALQARRHFQVKTLVKASKLIEQASKVIRTAYPSDKAAFQQLAMVINGIAIHEFHAGVVPVREDDIRRVGGPKLPDYAPRYALCASDRHEELLVRSVATFLLNGVIREVDQDERKKKRRR